MTPLQPALAPHQGRLPSVSLSGRDDARLLSKAYESLLSRWAKQVPGQRPKDLIRKFVDEGNVESTVHILEPEIRILKATMNSLQQQITTKCADQGDLMGRVEARYRRTIRILLKLARRVTLLKTRVEQRIPQVERGRFILTEAVNAMREQVEATLEAGDGRVDRGAFQNALSRLIENTKDQPASTEARSLRKLERVVDTLQRGRIEAEAKLTGATRELAAFQTAHEVTMARVREDIKVLQKALTSLKRNEGMTRKNRDNQINRAMDESFNRAQAIAAGSLERLQKQNSQLQTAVTTIKRQLTQHHFQKNTGSSSAGVQCDLSKEEEAEAAERLATAEKKATKRAKKATAKKKRAADKKKKKKGGTGAAKLSSMANEPKVKEVDSNGEAEHETGPEREEEKEFDDMDGENVLSKTDAHDRRHSAPEPSIEHRHELEAVTKLKDQVHTMTHLLLEKEAQIQYLQRVVQEGGGGGGGGSSNKDKRGGASGHETTQQSGGNNNSADAPTAKRGSKTVSTQYEENPVSMKPTSGNNGGSRGNNHNEGGRKKRPRRRKRGGGGASGGAGAQHMPPDPKADMRWARCWMSIGCAAACAAPEMGGFSPGKSFAKVFRCEMFRVCGSQGFSDLAMCVLYSIVRKRAEECRLLQVFARLLGITPVRSMEKDDTGLSSEDTVQGEYTALVLSVMAHANNFHATHNSNSSAPAAGELRGRPLLAPPEVATHRLPLAHSKQTVHYVLKYLGIPKPMMKGYVKALDECAEGHSKQNAVDVVDIIDTVEDAWRDQYSRRKVQLGAQYSMASATTNWFSRVDTCHALCKLEPSITPRVADIVFCDAVAMMRSHSAVVSSTSSTPMNPGVSVRTFIPALIRATWMHMPGPPRWVPSPRREHGGEDFLTLVNETMTAISRHMAGLMAKHACKPLRKLLIRMKHELRDSLGGLHEHAWGSHEYLHECHEHGERLLVLLQEIGSFVVGQDEATVRKTLKDLTGR